MAIQPSFSLSALNNRTYTYDPTKPGAPFFIGSFYSFGVHTGVGSISLAEQYNKDEVILGQDPVALNNQAASSIIDDFNRRSGILVQFNGINVNTNNQYLLLFSFRGSPYASKAQFFIGTDLVHIEPIGLNADEKIAILMDCPGNKIYTSVYVRHASNISYASIAFKGLDCFLL